MAAATATRSASLKSRSARRPPGRFSQVPAGVPSPMPSGEKSARTLGPRRAHPYILVVHTEDVAAAERDRRLPPTTHLLAALLEDLRHEPREFAARRCDFRKLGPTADAPRRGVGHQDRMDEIFGQILHREALHGVSWGQWVGVDAVGGHSDGGALGLTTSTTESEQTSRAARVTPATGCDSAPPASHPRCATKALLTPAS